MHLILSWDLSLNLTVFEERPNFGVIVFCVVESVERPKKESVMETVDILGYGAFVFDVLATWMFVYKNIWGWVFSLISLVLWHAYGWVLGEVPILVSTTTFFFICTYGLYKWSQED